MGPEVEGMRYFNGVSGGRKGLIPLAWSWNNRVNEKQS
jgi:hypothetical protein